MARSRHYWAYTAVAADAAAALPWSHASPGRERRAAASFLVQPVLRGAGGRRLTLTDSDRLRWGGRTQGGLLAAVLCLSMVGRDRRR